MTSGSSEHRVGESAGSSLDDVRVRFVAQWESDPPPQIETFLAEAEPTDRQRLFGVLLTAELQSRLARHEQPKAEEYHVRFPGQIAVIDTVFVDQARSALDSAESGAFDTFDEDPDITPIPPGALGVRCPVCQSHTVLAENDSIADVTCGQCGSQFGLSVEETTKHRSSTAVQVDPGQKLGHFQLEEQVGEGGFGAVWKARDLQLDRAVAVKIPHRGRLSLDEADKFLREARAAAQLRHPNLVGVHDVGVDGQLIYIVSDFIEGSSLDEWLKDRQPSFRDSARLCSKIARALHYAHQQGMIHRDLKPSNIMIDAEGEPHIMDFGLAKRSAGEVTMTAEGTILGTPAYMSPEQAKGEAHQADRRTDVYSLGVIIYELITGERPFRGNVRMLIRQVLDEEPPSPRKFNQNIPRDLETISLKCLRKEPPGRYASSEELADELDRYLDGVPILARPVGTLERIARWCRRNPLVAGSAAAALAGLLFGLSALLVSYVRTTQALADTRQAKAEAEDRLLFTKDAIDDLFTRISEETLLNQPGMQPLKHKLLRSAREYYVRFLKESGGDPAIRDELALAHYRLGRITEEIESARDAISFYEEARDVQTELLTAEPDNASRLEALGDTLNALGRALYKQGGRFGQALEACHAAIDVRTQLAQRFTESAEHKRRLANSTMNLGLVEKELDPGKALPFLREAQAIRREALAVAPKDKKLRRDLAMGQFNLAAAAMATEDNDLADQLFAEARQLFDELVREDPLDLNARHKLANSARLQADAKCLAGKLDDAPALYQAARDIMQSLAEKNPSVPEYQVGLAEIYMALGQLEFSRGDPDETMLMFFKEAHSLLLRLGNRRLEHPRYCRNYILTLATLQRMHPDADRRRKSLDELNAFRDDLARAVKQSPEAAGLKLQLDLCGEALAEAQANEQVPVTPE